MMTTVQTIVTANNIQARADAYPIWKFTNAEPYKRTE
jgi:hypothetical protein